MNRYFKKVILDAEKDILASRKSNLVDFVNLLKKHKDKCNNSECERCKLLNELAENEKNRVSESEEKISNILRGRI